MGSLSILNVYKGDVKITYDKDNPAEAIRAGRMIKDMLKRGYALLIEVDGKYQRALDFDESVGEYVIADFDPTYKPERKADQEDLNGEEQNQEESETGAEEPAPKIRSKRGPKPGRRRISMSDTEAVAIAPTAGG